MLDLKISEIIMLQLFFSFFCGFIFEFIFEIIKNRVSKKPQNC